MTRTIERALEVLERTPIVLRSQLLGISDFWALSRYGPETFSPFDVVGHLIHGDRTNWMVRVNTILQHGDALPFPAFDRYAMYETSQGKSMNELLDTFAAVRADCVSSLKALRLTEDDLKRQGTHPQLGTVTLGNLLAAWAVHDLGHTHQIAKAMAFQFREEVGPWREFLTILPRG